jgi:5'-3' exonuclease
MSNTFIFIDGSYFCFYRYHSLITWWKNAYPEQIDALQNPFLNEQFVEKFKKTFVTNIQCMKKKLQIPKIIDPIIIVGRDCKRQNIWRNDFFANYKGTRNDDTFMGGPFFKMVYDENLFIDGGAKQILYHSKLEADDCIAIATKHLLNKYTDCNIYIITSDKDYLQLAEPRVHLYNLGYKKLTDQKTCTGNAECDLFCKIVSGDPSDNIISVFPKCGPKTALKYFNDKQLFQSKLDTSVEFMDRYKLNQQIIDFNFIPLEFTQEVINDFDF